MLDHWQQRRFAKDLPGGFVVEPISVLAPHGSAEAGNIWPHQA